MADLPRVGVTFSVEPRFTRLRWFGRGPHENYPDRNRSALVGIWEAEPDECPYLVPQEYGLRTDCRWFELLDPTRRRGPADRLAHRPRLSTSLRRTTARRTCSRPAPLSELKRRDELVVCVDVAHRGLGTASCGPDVLPRYRLAVGRYELVYRLSLRRQPA